MKELIEQRESFAFETTLSTKSYKHLIESSKALGYEVILLFLTLDSVELAIQRVATRVKEGGHNIPIETIKRRFHSGLNNLFKIYIPIVNKWILVDNSTQNFEFIAEGSSAEIVVRSESKWSYLNEQYNGN